MFMVFTDNQNFTHVKGDQPLAAGINNRITQRRNARILLRVSLALFLYNILMIRMSEGQDRGKGGWIGSSGRIKGGGMGTVPSTFLCFRIYAKNFRMFALR